MDITCAEEEIVDGRKKREKKKTEMKEGNPT
jgi:hypothetical protein